MAGRLRQSVCFHIPWVMVLWSLPVVRGISILGISEAVVKRPVATSR